MPFAKSLSANYLSFSPRKRHYCHHAAGYSFLELKLRNLGTVALEDSTYLCDGNVRDILVILVLAPLPLLILPPQARISMTALVFFWICSLEGTYCTLQKVLTHVLEEAGYTKDSHFTLPDFMKVSLFLL
jgi:hypothetical protein